MPEDAPLLPATVPPAERRRARGYITLLIPVVLVLATLGVLIFGKREPSDPLGLAQFWLEQWVVLRRRLTEARPSSTDTSTCPSTCARCMAMT